MWINPSIMLLHPLLLDFFMLISLGPAKLSNLGNDIQIEALLVNSGDGFSVLEQNHTGGLGVCIPFFGQFYNRGNDSVK
jgi:hypothetical protein